MSTYPIRTYSTGRLHSRRQFVVGDRVQLPDCRTGTVRALVGEMLYDVQPDGDITPRIQHDLELLLVCFSTSFASPHTPPATPHTYGGEERRAA